MIDWNGLYLTLAGAAESVFERQVLPNLSEPLTKRERFAMAAMQGMLASDDRSYQFEHSLEPNETAKTAVALADALIAQLAAPIATDEEVQP